METLNENNADVEDEPVFNLETVERVIRQLEGPTYSGSSLIYHVIISFIHSVGTRVSCLFKERKTRHAKADELTIQ